MKKNVSLVLAALILCMTLGGGSVSAAPTDQLFLYSIVSGGYWTNSWVYNDWNTADGTIANVSSSDPLYNSVQPALKVTKTAGTGQGQYTWTSGARCGTYINQFNSNGSVVVTCYVPTGNTLALQFDMEYYDTSLVKKFNEYPSARTISVPAYDQWCNVVVPISNWVKTANLATAPYVQPVNVKPTVWATGTKTAYIKRISYIQGAETNITSVTYKNATGTITGRDAQNNLTASPTSIVLQAGGAGTIDPATLSGITLTKDGATSITVTPTLNATTNQITITFPALSPGDYELNADSLKVYGNTQVSGTDILFGVASATSVSSIALKNDEGNVLSNYITSDLKTMELSFAGTAIDMNTIGNIKVEDSVGNPISSAAAQNGNNVIVTINDQLFDNQIYYLKVNGLKNTSATQVVDPNYSFTIKNKIIVFDDSMHYGTLGATTIVDNSTSKTGSASIKYTGGDLVNFNPNLNLKEPKRDNWIMSYYLKSNEGYVNPNDGKKYFPLWHSYVNGSGAWFGYNSAWCDYNSIYEWKDSSWSKLINIPFNGVDNNLPGITDPVNWQAITRFTGGVKISGETVWIDQYMFTANTKINVKNIVLKDADGSVIINDTATPKTAEITFEGPVYSATLNSGVSLNAGNIGVGMQLVSYQSDTQTAIYNITGNLVPGKTHTLTVSGVQSITGKPQTMTVTKTFTAQSYLSAFGTYSLTYKDAVGNVVVNPETTSFVSVDANIKLTGTVNLPQNMIFLAYKQYNQLIKIQMINADITSSDNDKVVNITLSGLDNIKLVNGNQIHLYIFGGSSIAPIQLFAE